MTNEIIDRGAFDESSSATRSFRELTYRRHVFPSQHEARLIHDNVGVKAQIILRHIESSMHQNVFLNCTRIVCGRHTRSKGAEEEKRNKNFRLITFFRNQKFCSRRLTSDHTKAHHTTHCRRDLALVCYQLFGCTSLADNFARSFDGLLITTKDIWFCLSRAPFAE